MMKPIAIAFVASLLFACGGSQPAAEGPEDAPEATDDVTGDVADDAGPTEAPSRNDGIVRDADGDGVPDDAGGGCAGKNETQCQITAGCAWSDGGECVEAGG